MDEAITENGYDLAMPFLGMYLEELKSLFQSDICISLFTIALIHNRQARETTQMLVKGWLSRGNKSGLLLSWKKGEPFNFV